MNSKMSSMNNKFKILDCTLRDGGYINNWDFNFDWVKSYIETTNSIESLSYIEIGYKNPPSKDKGRYYQLSNELIYKIKSLTSKKIAIMIDVKLYSASSAIQALKELQNLVDLVRLAVNFDQLDQALDISCSLRSIGFKTAICLMKIADIPDLAAINFGKIYEMSDMFYLMDSYGRIETADFENIFNFFKTNLNIPLGFHPHNDKGLALINAGKAIELGCDFIDTTIDGCGRGAGNLPLSDLLKL